MLKDLSNVPHVMRSINWPNSARFLDRWFSLPRAVSPSYSSPDTTLRISWVPGFARARRVYDDLIRDRIWSNSAGQGAVGNMLRRKGLLTQREQVFGRLFDPVPQQDRDYVNQRPAGGYSSFDDLTGTLGAFNFRVVVAGTVKPHPDAAGTRARPGQSRAGSGFLVRITEVGVYVRDSFDFEGDQYLGCWSDAPHAFLPIMPPTPSHGVVFTQPVCMPVGNRDFRVWRDRHGRGGDFLVFSDLQRVVLPKPDEFTIS